MSAEFTPTRFADVALPLRKHGYSCFPTKFKTKTPAVRNWPTLKNPSDKLFQSWIRRYPDCGAGLLNLVGIDIDIPDPDLSKAVFQCVVAHAGPTSMVRFGRYPILFYRAEDKILSQKLLKVDILSEGRFAMGFGIHPVTNAPFYWPNWSPLDVPFDELTLVWQAQIDQMAPELLALQGGRTLSARRGSSARGSPSSTSDVIVDPQTALVTDGRDAYMRNLVYAEWCGGLQDPYEIAERAWRKFEATTDLRRGKRGTSVAWSKSDALEKARYLVASGKQRPPSASHGVVFTDAEITLFTSIVRTLAVAGIIPRSAARLSEAMMNRARHSGVCYAAMDTLVRDAKISTPRHAKKLRHILRKERIWICVDEGGGNGQTAHYVPNREVLTWANTL